MQDSRRPRRTSELHEEPGTVTKRQLRVPVRSSPSTGPSPAKFGTARKVLFKGTLNVTGSAAKRSGMTPMRDNKKWIQDKTQRITEYLKNAWTPGSMAGISDDFFSRSNCLKQMSIKQFVAIINHFLHFIWGNRFTVGSNHVEDIISILQKLDYPYQVNRSWLITPNTTHSFGNVITLLDYLMDFVPDKEIFIFSEDTSDSSSGSFKELDLDAEFKAKLFYNCLKSYHLWDKKLDDELTKMKRQVADMIVQKHCCGIEGVDALDKEIENLNQLYGELRKQRPHIDPDDEEKCNKLKSKYKKICHELENISDLFEKDDRQIQQMTKEKESIEKEINCLESENNELQMAIEQQFINVQQERKLVAKVGLLRTELQSYERTLNDLNQREAEQTEEISNMWQTVTALIEKLNSNLRDLIPLTDPSLYYQIPLYATEDDIKQLLDVLNTHRDLIEQKLQAANEQKTELELEIDKINTDIAANIEPKYLAQSKAIESARNFFHEFELKIKKESTILFTKQEELQNHLKELNFNIEDAIKILASKKTELLLLTKENEDKLTKAEEAHRTSVAEREARIATYEAGIRQCMQQLQIVKDHMDSHIKKSTETER